MSHLLALAEWLCGEELRRSTFEPLLADWQHELQTARGKGRARVIAVSLGGAVAFVLSVARCAMTASAWRPASKRLLIAAATFVVAFAIALSSVWLLSLPRGFTRDLGAIGTQSFLASVSGVTAATVLLPVLFMLRRDARSTTRHAIGAVALGAIVTGGITTLTSQEALNGYFSSFESFERQYQRDLANDRAGRVTYPGSAVRHLRGTSTIEQRRAAHTRFMAMRAEWQARQPPLTTLQRARRLQPVALAVLFGVMGWTLAGLGPATIGRAAGWWALMFVATLAFGVMPRTLMGAGARGLPHALALPLFGAIALALLAAHARQNSRSA